MPQLDITYFPTQIFWLCVFFILFTYVLWKAILPGIKFSLDQRSHHISAMSTKSENDSKAAMEIRTTAEDQVRTHRANIDMRLKEISSKVTKKLSAKRTALGNEYKVKIRQGFKEIQDSALKIEESIIKEDLMNLVKLASERITKDAK